MQPLGASNVDVRMLMQCLACVGWSTNVLLYCQGCPNSNAAAMTSKTFLLIVLVALLLACLPACLPTCMSACLPSCLCECVRAYVGVFLTARRCVCLCLFACACLCACLCVCLCMCACVHVCVLHLALSPAGAVRPESPHSHGSKHRPASIAL